MIIHNKDVVESNIQRNSRGLYSSNTTAIYDTSSFSTSCRKSPERNSKTPQKGPILFTGDNKTQKMITSNETRLTIAITDLIISE